MAQTTDRLDGWTLWARSMIASALAEERKAFAETLGKIIAEERARVHAEHVKTVIEIASLGAEIAALRRLIAETAGAPVAEEPEVVRTAGTRH